jgi:hypothetical protein
VKRPGRRCALGCESWPDEAIYSRCPVCGQPTERVSNLEPLSDEDARSILLHAEFEKYYEKYCGIKNQPVNGPLEDVEYCV